MKDQRLMKHSPSLIGADVHVYKSDLNSSHQPRAGKIIGFHPDAGLFEVLVMTSYSLDQRGGRPGLITLPRCLVIDDPNEIPVGVSEYAIIRGNVDNFRVPSVTTDVLAKTANSPEPKPESDKLVPQDHGMTPATMTQVDQDDKPAKTATQKKEKNLPSIETSDSRALLDAIEDGADDATADDDDDNDENPAKTEKTAKAPATGQAAQIMFNSAEFAPVLKIKGVACEVLTPNEIIVTINDDDKPLARLIYVKRSEPVNMPTMTPFGWTIKLRDGGGRCSRILDQNMTTLPAIAKANQALKTAILLALNAKVGDYASASENMQAAVNQYKSA